MQKWFALLPCNLPTSLNCLQVHIGMIFCGNKLALLVEERYLCIARFLGFGRRGCWCILIPPGIRRHFCSCKWGGGRSVLLVYFPLPLQFCLPCSIGVGVTQWLATTTLSYESGRFESYLFHGISQSVTLGISIFKMGMIISTSFQGCCKEDKKITDCKDYRIWGFHDGGNHKRIPGSPAE